MLELAILGLLTEESLHGYELKKQLADTLGFASGVSFGSLYPALGRLEAAGAVRVLDAPYSLSPGQHTGSLGGELAAFGVSAAHPPLPRGRRGKKVYGITPRGRDLFEELLAAESRAHDDDRVFALRLAFARHLLPAARLGMLERRRARLVERLLRLGVRVGAGRERLDGYGRTLAEHDRDVAQHDLSWIDQLIARERATAAAGEAVHAEAPPSAAPSPAVPSISALCRARPARPETEPASPAGPAGDPISNSEGLRPRIVQEDTTV